MTVNIPSSVAEIKLNVVELKLDRLIDEMRSLRSTTIAFDTRLRGITARKQIHAVVGGGC